ncbi:MAG TPA: hypothetical protein VD867_05920 [Burkholderiales bacterium]|nr:hypothetical protein [Burkholderiales bacterium]
MKTARAFAAGVAAAACLASACAVAAQAKDSTPRRLMISVAQGVAADGTRQGVGVTSAPQVRIWDSRSTENVRVLQTVQALEGRSALVQMGQSVPVRERQVTRSIVGGRMVEHVVDGVDYRSANTGFLVLPRLSGDQVTLEIAAQREAFVEPKPGRTIDSQRVVTTVSGRLGEWIEVSAMSDERGSNREGILGRAGDMRSESRSVLLKVDELR